MSFQEVQNCTQDSDSPVNDKNQRNNTLRWNNWRIQNFLEKTEVDLSFPGKNNTIEFSPNGREIQWIKWIQGIWQITEAWIGDNLPFCYLCLVLSSLSLMQEVVGSRLTLFAKIFGKF